MRKFVAMTLASVAMLVITGAAHAVVEPGVKCESSKLKVSGKYAACRLNAAAKSVVSGEPADASKCEASFTDKFTGAEEKAGTECPTEGDDAGVAAAVEKFGQGVVEKVKYPGLRGSVRLYTPAGEHWLEDDGVEPETPGCHRAFEHEDCTVPIETAGGVIGEACVTVGAETLLLETNPDAPLCHSHHEEDVLEGGAVTHDEIAGHPYLYSCQEYCQGLYGQNGTCVAVVDFCGAGINSARCQCSLVAPD